MSETPMGFLPTLEVDDTEVISQSCAVARFVARECKLVPDDVLDAALADSVVDCVLELRDDALIPVVFGKEEEKVNCYSLLALSVFS